MKKLPYKDIIKFYTQAQTIYSAHSPFVYEFMKEVLDVSESIELVNRIEEERYRLKTSKEKISFIEYGAGSSLGENGSERSVSSIAKNSLSGKWQCRVLFNLIQKYNLIHVLEIGTSLGISTAYFAAANPNAIVRSLEGNPTSLEIAKRVWSTIGLQNIQSQEGEFSTTLPIVLEALDEIDFVFLDGNHRKDATLNYFELIKGKLGDSSVVIVDDIYWSEGMHEAWEILKEDASVAFSIDLFRMGILFFDHSIMQKQHFKLIQYKYKPWAIGLFG